MTLSTILALCITAISSTDTKQFNIVTTTAMVGDIAHAVVGDRGTHSELNTTMRIPYNTTTSN